MFLVASQCCKFSIVSRSTRGTPSRDLYVLCTLGTGAAAVDNTTFCEGMSYKQTEQKTPSTLGCRKVASTDESRIKKDDGHS